VITGFGVNSYRLGLRAIVEYLRERAGEGETGA
jgi:3-dehydroquinate dehydratase